MASLGIFARGNHIHIQIQNQNQNQSFLLPSKSCNRVVFKSNPFVSMRPRKPSHGISASLKLSNPPSFCEVSNRENCDQRKDSIFSQNLDDWMKVSAAEIVRNLKKAPLLVQIYTKNEEEDHSGSSEEEEEEESCRMIKTEQATMEKWPILQREWERGESKSPDGLIYVEEIGIDDQQNLHGYDFDENSSMKADECEGITKAWGVVVQGRGVECGPACYLLKTSRVGVGVGVGCTHFCLVRVKSFRNSVFGQFKDSWL